jgi:acetoin utilization protein AcuC
VPDPSSELGSPRSVIRGRTLISILYSEKLREFDFGLGHPFRGDRYRIFAEFIRRQLNEGRDFIFLQASEASDEDLSLIASSDYIRFTKEYYYRSSQGRVQDPDFWRYHTTDNYPRGKTGRIEEATRLIVGQAKLAADRIQQGEIQSIVSIGGGQHHAKPNRGEGFCLYNDVAFAGKYLVKKHQVKRVLILDTDAHAGTGTAEYFYTDPRVLLIDLHQDPRTLYPGTGFVNQIGKNAGEGYNVNVPLPPGTGDSTYLYALNEIFVPLAEEFKPEIIIANGGSDPHFADMLGDLSLTVKGLNQCRHP